MLKTDAFELNVDIWFEDDEWNYSLIQAVVGIEEGDTELLAYGVAESAQEAAECVADELTLYVKQVLL
jgi:hypothetical protein